MVKSVAHANGWDRALERQVQVLREGGTPEELIEKMVVASEETLITLEEASETYSIPYGTLLRWLHVGRLVEKGRQKFAAPGGGKVLVSGDDVDYLAKNPPRSGRPRKGE